MNIKYRIAISVVALGSGIIGLAFASAMDALSDPVGYQSNTACPGQFVTAQQERSVITQAQANITAYRNMTPQQRLANQRATSQLMLNNLQGCINQANGTASPGGVAPVAVAGKLAPSTAPVQPDASPAMPAQ